MTTAFTSQSKRLQIYVRQHKKWNALSRFALLHHGRPIRRLRIFMQIQIFIDQFGIIRIKKNRGPFIDNSCPREEKNDNVIRLIKHFAMENRRKTLPRMQKIRNLQMGVIDERAYDDPSRLDDNFNK